METNLTGISETLLITLFMRAKDAQSAAPVLHDHIAAKVIRELDYDFSDFDKVWMSYYGTVARAKMMDDEAKKFIATHPDASVVSLGCGLDTRFQRIDNGRIHWYNLDLPEVITLRHKFLPSSERSTDIAASAFDFKWPEQVAACEDLLIISEGVIMYFTPEEMKQLLRVLTAGFPSFTAHFDMVSAFVGNNSERHDVLGKMNVPLYWGTRKGKEITEWAPELQQIGFINFTDYMKKLLPGWKKLLTPMFYYVNNRMGIYYYQRK